MFLHQNITTLPSGSGGGMLIGRAVSGGNVARAKSKKYLFLSWSIGIYNLYDVIEEQNTLDFKSHSYRLKYRFKITWFDFNSLWSMKEFQN